MWVFGSNWRISRRPTRRPGGQPGALKRIRCWRVMVWLCRISICRSTAMSLARHSTRSRRPAIRSQVVVSWWEMLEWRRAVPNFVLRESCGRPWSLSAIGYGDGVFRDRCSVWNALSMRLPEGSEVDRRMMRQHPFLLPRASRRYTSVVCRQDLLGWSSAWPYITKLPMAQPK